MKFQSLFVVCLLAATTFSLDLDDLALMEMDSADAFDDVLTLLEQLENQSKGELQQLQADWEVQGKALMDVCMQQRKLLQEKTEECAAIEGVRDGFQDAHDTAVAHIAWIDQRFIDNDEKLENFKRKRCEANLLFVQHLMEHKQSLTAVCMLRDLLAESSESDVRAYSGSTKAILADLGIKKHSNEEIAVLKSVLAQLSGMYAVMPSKMQGSFLEMNSQFDIDPEFNMMNELSSDMSKKSYYAPKKFAVQTGAPDQDPATDIEKKDAALDAQEDSMKDDRATYGDGYHDYESDVAARTDVGTDHIDDKTDDMEMRDLQAGERTGYAALQQQILDMLDDLVHHLEESMQRMMDDEIAASAAFADWKILTENEEVVLAQDREKEVAAVADFQISIDEQDGLLATCRTQHTAQELNANQACGAHATAESAFTRKSDGKKEEINLFAEVKAKYQRMAADLDGQLRQRVGEQQQGKEMTDYQRQVA